MIFIFSNEFPKCPKYTKTCFSTSYQLLEPCFELKTALKDIEDSTNPSKLNRNLK